MSELYFKSIGSAFPFLITDWLLDVLVVESEAFRPVTIATYYNTEQRYFYAVLAWLLH